MDIVSKITVKGICGALKEPEKPVKLLQVYGLVRSSEVGKTTYGEYIRFRGNFEAVNLETGQMYQSGALILPAIAESLLYGAAASLEEGSALRFAFEIGIKPSKSPTGYDYTVTPLVEGSENDPLADLRSQVKALPSSS